MANKKDNPQESAAQPQAQEQPQPQAQPEQPAVSPQAEFDKSKLDTKQALDRKPKVKIRLKAPQGKNDLNYEVVCINGYVYQIMRGVDVEVPQPVRDLLIEAGYL